MERKKGRRCEYEGGCYFRQWYLSEEITLEIMGEWREKGKERVSGQKEYNLQAQNELGHSQSIIV